ncbi:POK10 protein, partial [Lophotis ruficrista]|nr:POK10 protein [Lophotis ruficrista]
FITEGNNRADKLTLPLWKSPVPNKIEQATASHEFYHQSARALKRQFQLSWTEAQQILQTCPDCQPFATIRHNGVNPRGLAALQLWQTDITHISQFGRYKYVHVSIDTFSHATWATAC